MRIFSNTILAWPEVFHVFQAARLSSRKWQNYSFYHIQQRVPLILTTHSSIRFLESSKDYYCYQRLYRDTKLEQSGSEEVLANKHPIWIPSSATVNDIIVIRHA